MSFFVCEDGRYTVFRLRQPYFSRKFNINVTLYIKTKRITACFLALVKLYIVCSLLSFFVHIFLLPFKLSEHIMYISLFFNHFSLFKNVIYDLFFCKMFITYTWTATIEFMWFARTVLITPSLSILIYSACNSIICCIFSRSMSSSSLFMNISIKQSWIYFIQ